jgi:hypothetical protein
MMQEQDNTPFLECILRGNAVSCSSEKATKAGKESLRFEGHVSGDVISGVVTGDRGGSARAMAKRDAGTMVSIAE